MFLRDQALNAVGQQCQRFFGVLVGSGVAQEQVLFMFQRLAGRAISDPVLLILVQLLNGFDNQDDQTQHGRDFLRVRDTENRKQREQGRSNDLNELQKLIALLRRLAFPVVLVDLVV